MRRKSFTAYSLSWSKTAKYVDKTSLAVVMTVWELCILDLSKTLMYDFQYNYIKQKYGNRAKLLFRHSPTYEIKTEDCSNDKGKFDNSDYPKYFNWSSSLQSLAICCIQIALKRALSHRSHECINEDLFCSVWNLCERVDSRIIIVTFRKLA